MSEPKLASDYHDRGARAAHAVLIELGLVLGAHRDAIVVIGGSVPSLLLPKAEPSHIPWLLQFRSVATALPPARITAIDGRLDLDSNPGPAE